MKETELKPCPKCKGRIRIFVNIERGAFAKCSQCQSEFDLCGVDKVPTYGGVKFRKSTIRKIQKIWNRRADNEQREAD